MLHLYRFRWNFLNIQDLEKFRFSRDYVQFLIVNLKNRIRIAAFLYQTEFSSLEMTINKQIINSENVNGFNITLKVEKRNINPTSQRYVISYKNNEQKSSLWSKKSLICAMIFNILAMTYISISFTATSIIIIVMSFLIFFWVTHTVQSETLLVIPTVGIQTSVKYVVGREDNYVSWNNIDDVIINEVIKFNRVLYFLTILVKSNNQAEQIKLMPLFKYTKPRLMMLEMIYSEIQSLLIDSRKETNEFRDGQGSGDK